MKKNKIRSELVTERAELNHHFCGHQFMVRRL